MGFLIRKCVRCGVTSQLNAVATSWYDGLNAELFMQCTACGKSSMYEGQPQTRCEDVNGLVNDDGRYYSDQPIVTVPNSPHLSKDIPEVVRKLFNQAFISRALGMYDASGSMFRKSIDVATKIIYETDIRLEGKTPAQAPRSRIEALNKLNIIEDDIWELADVALLDGNDAAHDIDPYTSGESESLEELTLDLLDRLFVRPARVARVKAKQLEAGVRKA